MVIISISILLNFFSCRNRTEVKDAFFETLDSKRTGIDFRNNLKSTPSFNMFKYMYFYNGAGVGAGDFNNDGLTDLFFSANQEKNALYLNKDNMEFRDVTDAAGIPQDGAWSTGVSVVDINNDGLLDIYICRVGNYEILKSKNQFLVCTGIKDGVPVYEDRAGSLGLDFSGFGTQAAFLDFDMDGDLDMYLMNHSLRFNGTFNERKSYEGSIDSLAGDYLFRNDGGKFTDVSTQAGILQYIIGYGLGIAVSDINLDGYPDIYIGNDFHENDYLYINQGNGTFKETLQDAIMQTSQFSMGVDIADITNDGYPEIISMDMLPEDPYILKRSLGEDAYDLFHFKMRHGYSKQFARNTLQLNRGNNTFSEIGRYAGVYATDWSWAALWIDFNNDGWKDLFVSNGIPKRLNDMDYVNHVSNDEIQLKIRTNRIEEKDLALEKKFPEIKLPNKFYLNKRNARFDDISKQVVGNAPSFSNGAAYADLDNDGDLDIVVNNIDDAVLIYRNRTNEKEKYPWMELRLKGSSENINALGSKAIVYSGKEIRIYEKSPVRGFQGSMEGPLHIGLGASRADSALLVWPDNTYQRIDLKPNAVLDLIYSDGLPAFQYGSLHAAINESGRINNITAESGLLHKHEENPFNEFDREPLMPRMVSREGPALAVGDINGDGLDDLFIGSSKFKKSVVFLQNAGGKFINMPQPALAVDSSFEDVDACWVDFNGDGFKDLAIASGGNEFYGNSEYLKPRVYFNDGHGNLSRNMNAFGNLMLTASCIQPYDFTGDGHVDLFIGGRAVPWEYGQVPQSYLLKNDGRGNFTDVTASYSPALNKAGFVKNAAWADLDSDSDLDLILSLEWDGITAFKNGNGKFEKMFLTEKKGWWNFTLPVDIDNDGDLDLVAGNLGLNSRLKASMEEPVRLYYNDFDGNGKKEQFVTYYLQKKEIPFANKDELQKQIPFMKKKYLYAEDFAKADLQELASMGKLRNSDLFEADYFSNVVLINEGNWKFTLQELPWEAQLTQYMDGVAFNANGDSLPDILLVGNFYPNNIQMGHYDADYGCVLINKGKGRFKYENLNGYSLKGESRHIRKLKTASDSCYVVVRNNDSTFLFRLK